MNRCKYCKEYCQGDNLICEYCREDQELAEDDGSLDIETEDNWLSGLDRVVKRKEKSYEA
jgi:hypothetical protein